MSMDELTGGRDESRKKEFTDNEWAYYKLLVLNALDRMERTISEIRKDISTVEGQQNTMRESIAGLNVKAGIWGAAGAAATILGYLVMNGKR